MGGQVAERGAGVEVQADATVDDRGVALEVRGPTGALALFG